MPISIATPLTISQVLLLVGLTLTFLLQLPVTSSAYGPVRLQDQYGSLRDIEEFLEDTTQPRQYDIPVSDALPTDKRYARLSYYYGSPSSSRSYRNRYPGVHYRYYRSRYYKNYYKPWLNLPDTQCLREQCFSDNDCCRRYSKCDKSAHVCYSCWYGHPCKTSRDCCERYPYCNKHKGNICVS